MLWVGAALAAPLVPRWDEPRTVKIDVYFTDPGMHPDPDWELLAMTQETAVLKCTPVARRTESCAYVDGLWLSYVVSSSTTREERHLEAPGTLVLTWSVRGTLAQWDIQGDRSAFWNAVGEVLIDAGYKRHDVKLSADERRRIGQEAEQSMARALAAALEWELPKDPTAVSWTSTHPPTIARTHVQSTITAHLSSIATPDDANVRLEVTGEVAENLSNGSVASFGFKSKLVGTATFDPRLGRVVAGQYETRMDPSVPDYRRTIAVVAPWSEGESTGPAPAPSLTLP